MVYYTIMAKQSGRWLKTLKSWFLPAAALAAAGLFLSACMAPATVGDTGVPGGAVPGGRAVVESGLLQFTAPAEGDLIAEIETDVGTIRAVLYGQLSPLAVENFTVLAGEGYYDGSLFHRVGEGFVVQGGAALLPEGAGEGAVLGDADRSIWGHPFNTEYTGLLHHYAGALCMAANGGVDTHESQFYIVAATPDAMDEAALAQLREAGYAEDVVEAYRQAGGLPYLDNTDTVFGQVIEGMEVVDAIAASQAGEDGRPVRDIAIKSVRITGYVPDEAVSTNGGG